MRQRRQLNFSQFLALILRVLDQRLVPAKRRLNRDSIPFGHVAEKVGVVHGVDLDSILKSQGVNGSQFLRPFESEDFLVELLGGDGGLLLSVVPAHDTVVSAGCEDQVRIGLAPLHGVDALSVAAIEYGDGALLVS